MHNVFKLVSIIFKPNYLFQIKIYFSSQLIFFKSVYFYMNPYIIITYYFIIFIFILYIYIDRTEFNFDDFYTEYCKSFSLFTEF